MYCNRCNERVSADACECPECSLPMGPSGVDDARPPLHGDSEESVRAATAVAELLLEVHDLGRDPYFERSHAISALLKVVEDRSNSAGVRRHAAALLGEAAHASPEVVAALTELLTDQSKQARLAAAAAIGALGAAAAEAIPALEEALTDESRLVRIAATEALGHMGDAARPAMAAIIAAMRSDRPSVRAAAAAALVRIDASVSVPASAIAEGPGEGDVPLWLAVDALPLGVALVGADGVAFRVNVMFRSLAQMIGLDVGRKIHHSPLAMNMVKQFSQWSALVLGTCDLIEGKAQCPTVDAGTMWLSVRATNVRSASGRVLAVLLTLEDITERQPNPAITDEFINRTQHDLRTALTSVLGAFDMLAGRGDRKLDSVDSEVIEMGRRSSLRLDQAVGDLIEALTGEGDGWTPP